MTTAHHANCSTTPQGSEKAITLALSLAQAQERVRESEDRLLIILESAGDGITVVDRGGFIRSKTAERRIF